jgi:hypothetical protein
VRCPEDAQNIVNDLEQKLADAKAWRDKILFDIRKAQAAIDAGDRKAVFTQGGLNKENVAVGRLILSLEREVAEARKRVEHAEAQAAAAALKQAIAAVAGARLYEVVCPDGVRKVRHRAASLEALRKVLQPGYVAVGQVFGHAEDGTGGFVSVPGAPSMLKALLAANGDDLIAYLAERGIGGPVVILPSNNRDLQ